MLRVFALLVLPLLAAAQETEIRQVLQQSVDDWNRADVAAFMNCYEDSPDTTYIGKSVARGKAAILARYQTNYASAEKMGRLKFSDIVVRMLTPELALVIGQFHLERSAQGGGPANGRYTLLMRKGPRGWRIIHDHSS